MAKLTIPDALKQDVPQTKWGRILTATPVIMTVVATALAGLSSSEMTRAQYSRSLAAQQQSKAGDQWSFFQAKRLRSSLQRNALDILQATTELHPLDPSTLNAHAPTVDCLVRGEIPDSLRFQPVHAPEIKSAIQAIEKLEPDTVVAGLVAQVNDKTLDEELNGARVIAQMFDDAISPINREIEALEKQFTGSNRRDFTVARLRYTAARYDAEARLNQAIANLYELQVRKGNIEAEHHRVRSQRFFYGMLAAQAAVIIATFSLAAQKRSLLWSLAAAAGSAAIAFAVYVYLFV